MLSIAFKIMSTFLLKSLMSCLYLFHQPSCLLVLLLHITPDTQNVFMLVDVPFWFTFSSVHNCCSPSLVHSLFIHVQGLLSSQAIFSRKPALITQTSQCAAPFSHVFTSIHFCSSIVITLYQSAFPVDHKIFVDKDFALIIFL